ncbi:MAG: hypothetical protein RLY87_2150 [Chloroflexota bacterium]
MAFGTSMYYQPAFVQVFDTTTTQTKIIRSMLIIFSTLLPTLLLFDGFIRTIDWISFGVCIITCALSAYLVVSINRNRPAAFLPSFVVLTLAYLMIAVRSFGIDVQIISATNAIVSLACATTMLGILITCWVPPHEGSETTRPLTAAEILGIVLLALLALGLRVYQLDVLPATHVLEAQFGLDARRVLEQNAWNPIALTFDSHAHLFTVLLSVAMRLFGDSFVAIRTATAVIGASTVILLYVASRRFFDVRTAWLASLAFVAMAIHLEFSRIATSAVLDAFLLCAVLAFLAIGWDTGRRRGYIAAGFALGFCQYTYHTGKIIPVIFAIWLCIVAIQNWELIAQRLPSLTMMWGVALLVSLPMWWVIASAWDTYRPAIHAVSLFAESTQPGVDWLHAIATEQQLPVWQVVLYTVRDAAAAFIAVPVRDGYDVGLAILTLPSAVLFIIGVLLMIREYDDPRYWLLFLGLISAVAIASITINTPAAQRMIYITPFVAIVVGIGLAQSSRWLRLEWVQADWSLPQWLIQAIGILLAIGIAGYDANNYLINNRNAAIQPADAMASAIGTTIAGYPDGSQAYAFTEPYMRYTANPILVFQAPQVAGIDVPQPLNSAPPWILQGPKQIFLFAPQRSSELALIRSYYPGGTENRAFRQNGETILVYYVLEGIPSLKTP